MDREEPPLPPSPELLNRQPKWFKPVFYFAIVASILFTLCCLVFYPMVFRSRRGPHYQTQAISNAKQIGLALFEFETDYGAYPSAATIPLVSKSHPAHGYDLSGKSSNAYFRQLFAVEFIQSEDIFYARIPSVVRPDNNITHGRALEKGEVGFAYISGLTVAATDPNTPLVLTPLIPGTTKFDPEPFKGKAVILHIDNSVSSYDIHKDGHVYDKGINLLSPKHPVWKGKAPDIRYPE